MSSPSYKTVGGYLKLLERVHLIVLHTRRLHKLIFMQLNVFTNEKKKLPYRKTSRVVSHEGKSLKESPEKLTRMHSSTVSHRT